MGLALTGTADHALLATLIQEARNAVGNSGMFIGRTSIQKMMYFLKATGVPMSYRFDLYHYGPFCEEILRDAEWLIADNVIVDRSPSEKYSNYAPSEEISNLLEEYSQFLENHHDKISRVAKTFAPMRPETLELIATLDYIYRQFKASGKNGPWKTSVINRFNEIKGNRFSQEETERVYDIMVKAGIAEA